MYFTVSLCAVILHLLPLFKFLEAETVCTLPNGGAGNCVKVSSCPPISQIYNKKHKSADEKLFLNQVVCNSNAKIKLSSSDTGYTIRRQRSQRSVSFGGTRLRIRKKICCPDSSEWSNFIAQPVDTKEPSPIEPTIPDIGKRNLLDNGVVISGAQFCGEDSSSVNKIIGGFPTAIDQYPWLALLEYQGGYLDCGGSLISPRFVITAGHCVDSRHGAPQFVRLSEYNTTSYPTDRVAVSGGRFETITVQKVPVEYAAPHPQFDRSRFIHDIGLVKLDRDAVFSDFVKIICLPGRDFVGDFISSTKFTVAGWGDDPNDSKNNDVKKDVSVPYVPLNACNINRAVKLNELQICAGGQEGKDTCRGDSGGPLMYEHKQMYIVIGVTSYGHKDCGTKGSPAVYTHVYKYLDWIRPILEGSRRV